MSKALLTVENLTRTFVNKKTRVKVEAVDNVSFSVLPGEILGVVGESGCGKSTLARCVTRLMAPTQGRIVFRGQDITALSQRELRPVRPHMQMVFQNPYSSFNPKHTMEKSLWEVGKFRGMGREEFSGRLQELLRDTGLEPEWLKRQPKELSGGQLQRFAILRALLTRPEFLVADEPVSALDVSVQAQILNLLLDLREKLGLTILFISHDLNVVRHVCDRVMVMYLGAVMELGDREAVLESPAHPYTQALLSAKPRESPQEPHAQVLLKGDVPSALRVPPGCRFCPRCPRAEEAVCAGSRPLLEEIAPGHFAACRFPGRQSDCISEN